jgi:hypothetical protein
VTDPVQSAARAARLATALRDNLARRKARDRAVATEERTDDRAGDGAAPVPDRADGG